jgi:type III secretion protein J
MIGQKEAKLPRVATSIVILGAALFLTGCVRKVSLVTGLNDQEAVAILASLYKENVHAEKLVDRSGSTAILVPEEDIGRATVLLQELGLPHPKIEGIETLFKREGMISSPGEERVRLYFGLSQELTKTLMAIDGVTSARVHIVIPDAADGKASPPTGAAVMLRHRGEFQGDVDKVRQLIANSVPGLAYSAVTVYLFESQPSTAETLPRPALPHEQPDMKMVAGVLAGTTATSLLALVTVWFRSRRRQNGETASGPFSSLRRLLGLGRPA